MDKNRKKYGLLPAISGIIVMSLVLGAAGLEKKAEKTIKSVMGKNSSLSPQSYEIPPGIKKTIEETVKSPFLKKTVAMWKITGNNEIKGYAFMDHARGKVHTFTFVVLFDPRGTIVAVRVIKYREEHGSEIKNKKWLKQFKEKSSNSSFIFGKEIDGISGATISARSITRGIQRLSLLMADFLNAGDGEAF